MKKFIHLNKDMKTAHLKIIEGVLTVIDGVVKIVTLGTLWTSLHYDFVVYNLSRECRKQESEL